MYAVFAAAFFAAQRASAAAASFFFVAGLIGFRAPFAAGAATGAASFEAGAFAAVFFGEVFSPAKGVLAFLFANVLSEPSKPSNNPETAL